MPSRISTSFDMRFRLLESEHSIRDMESTVDYLKEQILLMQEAITNKQEQVDRLRPRLQRLLQRETHHE
jgi:prefoldin subunit 5